MKQETLSLNGFDYVCTALPARTGIRVAAKLAAALAPGISELPDEGFEVEPKVLAKMLTPVLTNPDLADTLDYLIATFAERTQVNNVAQERSQPLARVIDTQFDDAYDDMISWLLFSVKLSLSSFFRGARGLGALVAAAGARSVSKSPASPETTGKSGG